jgi:FkbM family methyltransferase
MNIRPDSALLRCLVDAHAWEAPFSLIDVGASGGIDDCWRAFGNTLEALAFDPLVTEVERLNAAETRPGVRYEAAFVGANGFDSLFPPDLRQNPVRSRNDDPFPRVSAMRAVQLLQSDYTRDVYNRGAPTVMTTRSVALDDVVPEASTVDFIKVDTDGHDIEVLLGADRLIRSGVLGVLVECPFHGAPHPYANTLANIDLFLRERGLSMFDLDVNRYSRSALPAKFVYRIPAQTVSGQAVWGDALYLRDLGDPSYEAKHALAATPDRVAKLAALFALFGLADCVAELLTTHEGLMSSPLRATLLDLLPSELGSSAATYKEYVAAFERDPKSFYPGEPNG